MELYWREINCSLYVEGSGSCSMSTNGHLLMDSGYDNDLFQWPCQAIGVLMLTTYGSWVLQTGSQNRVKTVRSSQSVS